MSTNYYILENKCEKCGRYDKLHIGKLSCGWKFLFHFYPYNNIKTFEDWKDLVKKSEIIDEYDRSVSFSELLTKIYDNQKEKSHGEKTDNGFDYLTEDFC